MNNQNPIMQAAMLSRSEAQFFASGKKKFEKINF
jgi:hypothetical protein